MKTTFHIKLSIYVPINKRERLEGYASEQAIDDLIDYITEKGYAFQVEDQYYQDKDGNKIVDP